MQGANKVYSIQLPIVLKQTGKAQQKVETKKLQKF